MLRKIEHADIKVPAPIVSFAEFEKAVAEFEKIGWVPIIPVEMRYVEELLVKHFLRQSRILLIDDIDFDGVSSAYGTLRYLKPLFGENIDVYSTIEHGLNTEIAQISRNYGLVIIVDGGTNQEIEFMSLGCDVLIIDHHVPEGDAKHVIWEKCVEEGKVKTLVNCNSKYTEGLQCVSAGMLCYIVFHTFYSKLCEGEYESTDNRRVKRLIKNIDCYEIGAVSLIGDIVPIDKFVLSCLLHYFNRYTGSTEFVRELLVNRDGVVNMRNLQWEAIPLINYTKRLKDVNTMSMIYKYGVSYTFKFLEHNRRTGRGIVDMIELYGRKRPYNKFMYIDVSLLFKVYAQDISNFKGLMCNRVASTANVPVLVGIDKVIDGKAITEVSVRSQGYDSLAYFRNTDDFDGGGHASSCGFKIKTEALEKVLQGYDKFLAKACKETGNILRAPTIDALNINKMALANYLASSSLKTTSVIIDEFDHNKLHLVTQNEGHYDGIPVVLLGSLKEGAVLVKPLIKNYHKRDIILEISDYLDHENIKA